MERPCALAHAVYGDLVVVSLLPYVCVWAQDKRPADLHMAQPNVPLP
jgi:hypothetical protein